MPAVMVTLQNTHHSNHILSVLDSDSSQVEVLPGSGGDPVTLSGQALCALSPFFRGILSSLPSCVEPVLILPEATGDALHQFVILTGRGTTDILGNVGEVKDVIEVAEMFHIDASNYFVEKFKTDEVKPEPQEIIISPVIELPDTKTEDEESEEQYLHENRLTKDDIQSNFRENIQFVQIKEEIEAVNTDNLSCQYCYKAFKAKRYLRHHVLLKHSNDLAFIAKAKLIAKRKSLKHKCDICQQLFNSRNITKHIRNDHPEIDLRIPCNYCEKLFKTGQVRKRHEEDIHMNTRSFKCQTCELTFKRRDHLEGHMKIHTSEKKYTCGKCGYASFRARDLLKHMCRLKTHCCDLCGEKSVSRKGLQKHKKRSHIKQ